MRVKLTEKCDRARIDTLPADYVRRCRYTTFLHDRSRNRVLIGWYIGPESGRLFGAYCSQDQEYPEVDGYDIDENGTLQFDDNVQFDTWDEMHSIIKRAPELHLTEHMAYFMGVGGYRHPRRKAKIIPFPGGDGMSRPSFRNITAADVFFIDSIVDFFEADGATGRRRKRTAKRKAPRPCRYDRSAVMRSAWAYRKGEGLSMSNALKLAWADARKAAGSQAVA